MSAKEHTIETTLSQELYDKFLKIKEYFGFKANRNVIRCLIVEKYRSIQKEGWG